MLSQQVVSITDLRIKTKDILASQGVKYVFVNNKPQNVIMDIKTYEKLQKQLKQQKIIKEVEYAEKNNTRFDNIDTIMEDLFS